MYFIYSLDLETLTVKIHDSSNLKSTALDILNECAIHFIRTEHGEKRAEHAFKDQVKDTEIKEDGYFLRNSNESESIINVHKRTTNINAGTLWTSVTVENKHVIQYGITQAGVNLPIESSTGTIKRPITKSKLQNNLHDQLITELKSALNKRIIIQPMSVLISETESDQESEDSFMENPVVKLHKMLRQESGLFIESESEISYSISESEYDSLNSEPDSESEYEYESLSSESDSETDCDAESEYEYEYESEE